ncbi:MAG: hypothetical protein GX870_07695 [Candidatus Marinimicrobia bacterium]|nr:hypothetical protein [Candidatus Neomarinimicrobiota bacterium]
MGCSNLNQNFNIDTRYEGRLAKSLPWHWSSRQLDPHYLFTLPQPKRKVKAEKKD